MSIGNKKYVFVMVGLFLLIGVLSLALVCYSNLNNQTKLEEVSLKPNNKVDKNMFAIKVEKDDGSGYEDSDTFPTNKVLDLGMSSCIDSSGQLLEDALSYVGGIVNVSVDDTAYCYLYFENSSDVKIIVSTNGIKNTVPTSGIYKQTVSCDSGNITYNPYYQRLEIGAFNSGTTCKLNYTTDTTSYEKLSDVVVDNTDDYGYAARPKEETYANITSDGYGTTNQFSSTSSSSTSGTEVTNAFTYDSTNNIWSSVPSNLTSNTYYHIKMPVTETGYYQLCYTMTSGSTSNRLYVYKNTTNVNPGGGTYVSASSSAEKSGCAYIGQLTGGTDYVKITQRAYTTIATVSFYLQMANETEDIPIGNRYSGENPDNYVWFNNELWRIIGLVPACTTASSGTCSQTTDLVKIIRAESIGGLAYDAKSSGYTGLWGSNTLYTLLNTYYYGKQNGTGTAYCYGYQATAKAKCDYSEIGISNSSSDYYGQMIEDVYWNIGASAASAIPGTVYGTESATVTTDTAPIGLMSASDYGYAAEIDGYSTNLSSYNTPVRTGTNWLYGQGYEWTNTQYSGGANNALDVVSSGNVSISSAYYGYPVRPVLYLDAEVYKISGTGTMSDPYMIGM